MLQPYGDAAESDLVNCFREQANILAQSGVDGFIVETMIDLREAVDALLNDDEMLEEQKPSLGCNIKWKPGNEPDYFG